jgi:hypothetical protein
MAKRDAAEERSDTRHGKLVRAEHRSEGVVPWGIYGQYIAYMGVAMTVIIEVMLMGQACSHTTRGRGVRLPATRSLPRCALSPSCLHTPACLPALT